MRISGLTHSRHSIVQDNVLFLSLSLPQHFTFFFSFRPSPSSNFLRSLSLIVLYRAPLRPSHVRRASPLPPSILAVSSSHFSIFASFFLLRTFVLTSLPPATLRLSSVIPLPFLVLPPTPVLSFVFPAGSLSTLLPLSLCQSLRPFPTSSFH